MDARTRSNNYSISQGQPFYFSAEDIRQFVYCPRIIYFRYVLRGHWVLTPKMLRGQSLHERLCRGKDKETEGFITRYYNVRLEDSDLGLFALIDIIEFDGNNIKIIELKTGKHKPGYIADTHKLQVVAEAILAELSFGITVTRGAVWYEKDNETIEFEITDRDRMKVLYVLREMKRIVKNEIFPIIERPSRKCIDCEYKRFCWWA